jgi:uncharacterized protein (TIGR03086 family)
MLGTDLAASVALFEQSASFALRGLSGIAAADLGRPTPCTGWDLRTLLLHLADSAVAFTELITAGTLGLASTPGLASPPQPVTDAVAAVRDQTKRLLDALPTMRRGDVLCRIADQPLLASTAACAGAIEFATHGWDIAVARGADCQIPAELAADLLDLAPALVAAQARFPEFGPPVEVPSGATASDRLVGFLGRRPQGLTAGSGGRESR